MNYNKELQLLKQKQQELIDKAKTEGYILAGDKLVKDNEYIPVIEIYARGNTDYESYGSFNFIRKIIPLTQEQLNKIKNLKQTEIDIIENFVKTGVLKELQGINTLYEIFNLESMDGIDESNICSITEDLEDAYCLEDGQNLYLEFYFTSKYNNIDGYISVFDMLIGDLEEQVNLDFYFNKYLTN